MVFVLSDFTVAGVDATSTDVSVLLTALAVVIFSCVLGAALRAVVFFFVACGAGLSVTAVLVVGFRWTVASPNRVFLVRGFFIVPRRAVPFLAVLKTLFCFVSFIMYPALPRSVVDFSYHRKTARVFNRCVIVDDIVPSRIVR